MNNFKQNKLSKIMASLLIAGGLVMTGCSVDNQPSTTTQTTEISKEEALKNASEIVSKSSNGDFSATEIFEGPEDLNLYGIVIEPKTGPNKMIGWTSKDGKYFMPSVFDSTGESISSKYMDEYAGLISSEELADKVKDMGFVDGTNGPILTAFFEPFCGYCNQLYTQINPLVKEGKVRVRYLMVGFLRPDSIDRAAQIHFSDNPQETLNIWEESNDKNESQVSTDVTDEQRNLISEHADIMFSAGLNGTPAIMYCSNGEVQKLSGMPSNIDDFVQNIESEGHDACGG